MVRDLEEEKLSFIDHLKELRTRLIRSFLAVLIIFLPLVFFF